MSTHASNPTVLALAISTVLSSANLYAAEAAPPATLQQMWKIIQQQQKEIESLKQKAASAEAQVQQAQAATVPAAVPAKPATSPNIAADIERKTDILAKEVDKIKTSMFIPESREYKSQFGLGPAASQVYRTNKGVSIGGYGEATYTNYTSDKGSNKDSADMQRLIMYLGYKFNDHIILNNEIEFEHATTGEGAEEKGEISVEFSTLDFLLNPMANVRAGLMLMPMGFINEMHEPTTFHGVYRPDVERRVIPSTWREMGAGLFGDLTPELQYRLYAVNGFDAKGFASNGWREGRQSGSKARAEDFAFTGRLDYTPSWATGLMLGGSAYAGNAGQDQKMLGTKKKFFTQLYEGHLQWHYKGWEFRTLGAWGSVDNANVLSAAKGETIGKSTFGWYTEAAYDIMPHLFSDSSQYLAPFVRYERYDTIADAAQGYPDDPSQAREIYQAGLTYKPITNISLKADYRNISSRAGRPGDEFNLGVGFIY